MKRAHLSSMWPSGTEREKLWDALGMAKLRVLMVSHCPMSKLMHCGIWCYQCLQTSWMTVLFIVINFTFLAEMVLTCLDVWRCLKMFNFEGFSCHCSMSFHIFPCRSIGLLMFSPPSAGLAPARHSGCQCAQRSHRQSAVHSARAPSDSRRGRWQGPGLSRAGHAAQWWHMFVVSKC